MQSLSSSCSMHNDLSTSINSTEEDFIFSSVHDFPEVRDNIDLIAKEILHVIMVQKKKSIKDINKIFQATLQNYFLECYVCGLIYKYPSNIIMTKKEIKKSIESRVNDCSSDNESENYKKCPKYMQIIQAYRDEIEARGLQREIIVMLLEIISSQNENKKSKCSSKENQSKRHATFYQKKLTALLVLEFFLHNPISGQNYNNFTDLWNSVFLNFKINHFARERNLIQGKASAFKKSAHSSSVKEEKIASTKSMRQCPANTSLSYSQLLQRVSQFPNAFNTFEIISNVTSVQKSEDCISQDQAWNFDNSTNSPLQQIDSPHANQFEKQLSPLSLNLKRKNQNLTFSFPSSSVIKKAKTVSFTPLNLRHETNYCFEIIQSIGSQKVNENMQTIICLTKSIHQKM